MKKIKKTHKTNLPKEDVYYCGKLVCGLCGHLLTTSRTNKKKKDGSIIVYNGYRCVNREKNMCSALGMSHKKVESAFLEYIGKIADLKNIEEMKPNSNENEGNIELVSLKRRITQKNNKLKEIRKLFMDDKLDYKDYKIMKENLERELKKIEKEIKEYECLNISEEVKIEIPKSIKGHWLYLTDKEKGEFLTQFVERIVIVNRDKDKMIGKPEIVEVKFYED